MNRNQLALGILVAFGAVSCMKPAETLKSARAAHPSKILPSTLENTPVEVPPNGVLDLVEYRSPVGNLKAYLSRDPLDKKKHPAIVWITRGDCNSLSDVWTASPASNDQTASAYREAGIVTMYPSLRGGNTNSGQREGFLGEVDDILAAAAYLKGLDYVDSSRVYLGGHSTGGTLVLLTAELTDAFAGVVAFGPVSSPNAYGKESGFLPYDETIELEEKIRAPALWLQDVNTPTVVFEGGSGNTAHLEYMKNLSKNPKIKFLTIPNGGHFSVLFPTNKLLAQAIVGNAFFESAESIAFAANGAVVNR